MSALLGAGCGLVGAVVGTSLPVVVERVPAKRRVLAAPFPEVAAGLRSGSGIVLAVTTGALFAGTALRIGPSADLPAFLVLVAALVALTVIDLRSFVLPNRIVFPVTAASVVILSIAALTGGDGDALLRALVCAAIAFAAFTVLHLVSPRAMGFGDVKLSFLLGLDLGWLGGGEAVLGLALGFVYGAVIGIALIVSRVRSRKDHVPFGPFLAAGALTAVLVGDAILDWYRA